MFLQKIPGPRVVTLPDRSVMTQKDLPSPDIKHWTASRKAAVVKGVLCGLLPQSEALRRYRLSEEELGSWIAAATEHGVGALRATQLHVYRQR